jgi:hypothetical protein
MSDDRYDFSELEKVNGTIEEILEEDADDDPREGFRISMCCGNCIYFFYTGVKSRRGYCKLTNVKHTDIGAWHNPQIGKIAEKYGWPETHTTCTCEKHELRGRGGSIDKVEEWVDKKFNFDGTQREDGDFLEDEFDFDL